MKTNADKEQRVEIVNAVIREIASHDRRFFHHNGQIAELFIKGTKIWYKCEWINDRAKHPVTEICLSVPEYRSLKGWFHGGTLQGLVLDFRDFINSGKPANGKHGYGGLYSPHWGYSVGSMSEIRSKARELGYPLD